MMFGDSDIAKGIEAVRVAGLLLNVCQDYAEALIVALRTLKLLSDDIPADKKEAVVQNMETIVSLSKRAERARSKI